MSATQRRAKREAREAYEQAKRTREQFEEYILCWAREGTPIDVKSYYNALLDAERDAKAALEKERA
jgi:hypothetical protein